MMNRRHLLSLGITGVATAISGCVFGDDGDDTPTPTPTPPPEPQPLQLTSGSAILYDGLLFENFSVEVDLPDGAVFSIRTRQVEVFGGTPALIVNDDLQTIIAPYNHQHFELEPGTYDFEVDIPQGSVPDLTLELYHPDASIPEEYLYPINTEIFEVDELPTTLIDHRQVDRIEHPIDWLRGVVRPDIPGAVALTVHELGGDESLSFVGHLDDGADFEVRPVEGPGTYVLDFDDPGEIMFQLGTSEGDQIHSYTVSLELLETSRYRDQSAIELIDIDAPEAVVPEIVTGPSIPGDHSGGASFQWSVTVENPTPYPSRFESQMQRFTEEGIWRREDDIQLTLAGDSQTTYRSDSINKWFMVTHRYRLEAYDEEFVVEPDVTQLEPGGTVETVTNWEITIDAIEDSGITRDYYPNGEYWYVQVYLSITNLQDEGRRTPDLDQFPVVGETIRGLGRIDEPDIEGWFPESETIDAGETHEGWVMANIPESISLDGLGVQIGDPLTPDASYVWTTADEFGPFYEGFLIGPWEPAILDDFHERD